MTETTTTDTTPTSAKKPAPMPSSERILVPVAEAAAMLSIGRATLWRGAKDGTLPKPIKIGGATRWRVADLQRCFCATEGVASGANGTEARA